MLDWVLQHQGKTLEKEEREMSPWYLRPTIEARCCRENQEADNPEYINCMRQWIKQGAEYWMNNYKS